MITESRDAIRTALRTVFPTNDVEHIHLAVMNAGFARPALYMELIPINHQRLGADMNGYRIRWQIVYFPREDAMGNARFDDLHGAAEKLGNLFSLADTLTTPDGSIMAVEDFSLTQTDDVITCTVALRHGLMRGEPLTPKIGGVEIDIAVGEKEGNT